MAEQDNHLQQQCLPDALAHRASLLPQHTADPYSTCYLFKPLDLFLQGLLSFLQFYAKPGTPPQLENPGLPQLNFVWLVLTLPTPPQKYFSPFRKGTARMLPAGLMSGRLTHDKKEQPLPVTSVLESSINPAES